MTQIKRPPKKPGRFTCIFFLIALLGNSGLYLFLVSSVNSSFLHSLLIGLASGNISLVTSIHLLIVIVLLSAFAEQEKAKNKKTKLNMYFITAPFNAVIIGNLSVRNTF